MKKFIILIIIITIIILGGIFFLFKKRAPLKSLEETTKEFASLFVTFDYQHPEEYLEKIKPLLAPVYSPLFEEKFGLPSKERIEKEEWQENFSRLEEIKKIIKKQETKNSALFYVEIEVFRKDIRFPNPEFKDTIAFEISLVKEKNKWLVSDVQFSPEGLEK